MVNLLKFFRVESLPTTGGVVGGLYFVHGGEIAAGNGKLYVCTAENTFELYTGSNSSELSNVLKDYVTKTTKIAGVEIQDGISTKDLMLALKNVLDNSVETGKFITGFTVNEEGKLVATYENVETTDTTYAFASADSANNSGAYFTVTEEGKDPQTVYVNADLAGTAQTLINALDVTDAAVDGEYVSAVSQVDGKISVTRAKLPTESADVDSIDGVDGALTLRKGLTEVGSVNLAIEGKEIQASLVGSFEDGAQVNKLETVSVDGKSLSIVNKGVNWKLVYDSTKKEIQVIDINKDNAVVNFIDATDFIKDGMLSRGELVWCIVAEDGTHTEVAADTEGAIHCLKLVLNTDGGSEEIHIPLNELCDVYTGVSGEITVSPENVIGLENKTVVETTGEDITLENGGSFDVVTDVTYDEKGRIATVETSTVTLPTITIGNGEQAGSDEYVTVGVKTTAGVVSEVTVNTDALSTKIEAIEDEVSENAQVTAAALTDLNSRLTAAEDTLASGVGVMAVEGEDPYKFASLPAEDQALVQAHDDFVWTEATTDAEGKVTLDSQVVVMKSTEPAKGLATDAYVNERIAAEKVSVTSSSKTLEVTHDGNNYNVELAWQMF